MSEPTVHPTAIVAESARLEEGVVVGPYAVVDGRVHLGPGCEVHAHAVVTGRTSVGEKTIIHPHAVLGGPPQDLKYKGSDTRLEIGRRNVIRENVTFNVGTEKGGGVTRVGDDNMFMANSHVAHDCRVGNRVILVNNVMLAGHVHVHDGAIINGGAGIHHYATVGALAYIGGLSRINRDVPPYTIVEGHPSRVRGVNVIGLKRAGFREEAVRAIKEAYKLLFRSDRPMRDAVVEIKATYEGVPEVLELARFLEASEAGRQGRQGEKPRKGQES